MKAFMYHEGLLCMRTDVEIGQGSWKSAQLHRGGAFVDQECLAVQAQA